jgi:hypothetical protein
MPLTLSFGQKFLVSYLLSFSENDSGWDMILRIELWHVHMKTPCHWAFSCLNVEQLDDEATDIGVP